ncbi:hypothetical protein CWE12_01430 [Aliidiomarina sedimenti]|uniref:Chalcone isomerase domain-containing protein n=1 Tax=Aliidiomarina sedimenti TaxID=1933879 RepID=A0ABY0C1D7_9GAMM|nr:chalcone isomerase family protein [Aliidiomarina sedimenti]RUO31686.1 hypothetical protein CWE12_01430 [Aliidiomarina sedimenti]
MFRTITGLVASLGLALCTLAFTTSTAHAACQVGVVEPLEKVGETRLRVYFFKVYDAVLYTDSGNYPEDQSLALELSYLRDIEARQLVDTTRDEWQSLGYSMGQREEAWLETLSEIWPDVADGDCLLAYAGEQEGVRFYNAEGELGGIDDDEFKQRFFAIWLSEDSSFRRNRDELTGER